MQIDTANFNERIVGQVERVIFHNQDNGYHVLSVAIDENIRATVTINHTKIHEGITMEFKGNWTDNPKFGRQFRSDEAWEVPPSTKEGLISFLCSSFFSGIGPVKAARIVNKFGDETYDILDKNIERLLEIKGINKPLLDKIKEAWDKNREIKDIMIFLQSHKIPATLASKIYQEYEKDCVKQIQQDPYDLIYKIKGLGFKKADEIAQGIGFDLKSNLRVDACILYTINKASSNGHTYLTFEQLLSSCQELVGTELSQHISDRIYSVKLQGRISVYEHDSQERYYGRRMWEDENYVCDKILSLNSFVRKNKISEGIFNELASEKVILSEQQEEFVSKIINNGVSILTGGPGTGKSFTVKSIIHILEIANKSFLLCAPTGRAAKRLEESTGYEAKTIHRTLGWDPVNFGFNHNENNPLGCDFIVIDEASMIDINLCADLLRAIDEKTQVLFVGDTDQLPPVGAGDPLRDFISSETIPTYKLTQIFRQQEGSEIIQYSHNINNGVVPEIESPLMNPSLWKSSCECLFVDSGFSSPSASKLDFPKWSSLRYGKDVVDMIIHIYKETIPKYYGKNKDVQVLIPMRKGAVGTVELNKKIQESINPYSKNKNELKILDTTFREGDKVIQTSNNYDLNVFNGDIGIIKEVDIAAKVLRVEFDSNRTINYDRNSALELELAYCISIHKSQGSEFDYVIIPLTMSYYRMLYRNLIYTGLTRAKKLAIFIGERKALNIAVNNNNYQKRQTSLKEMIQNPRRETILFE